MKVREAFGLTEGDFKDILLRAVDLTFTDEETKTILRERLESRLSNVQ